MLCTRRDLKLFGFDDYRPIMERHGVDVVVAGHHPMYRRYLPIGAPGTKPITGGKESMAMHAMTIDPNNLQLLYQTLEQLGHTRQTTGDVTGLTYGPRDLHQDFPFSGFRDGDVDPFGFAGGGDLEGLHCVRHRGSSRRDAKTQSGVVVKID